MRYAIVSDLHANRQAWESVLADIGSCKVDTIVCLGDVVGYGPMPQWLLDQVRKWCAAVVIGNHDAAACGRMDASIFNDEARAVVEWTRGRIDDEGHRFLRGLPAAVEDEDVLFVHAETVYPERFDYIIAAEDAAESFAACTHRMVFVGHTHQQAVFIHRNGAVNECAANDFGLEEDCRYMVNVGSVGEPRNPDDLRGRYAIYDSKVGSVVFRAVEFDMKAYREDLDREGLPAVPYFLRVRESEEAAQRAPAMPEQRAMRLMPISQASKFRDANPAQPSRLVVVPLPEGTRRGSGNLPPVPGGVANGMRGPSAPVQSRKSHALAIWFFIGLTVVAAIVGSLLFRDKPDDEDVDLAAQMETESPERVVPSEVASPGAGKPVASAALPLPVTEMRPVAAGLLTYLSFDANLAPIAGSLKVTPKKQGKPKLVGGRLGKALFLDSKSAVTFGKAGDFGFDGDGLTVCFWYLPSKADAAQRIAIGNLPVDDSAGVGWQIAVSNHSSAALVSAGEERVRTVLTLPKKDRPKPAWHHLAMVVDPEAGQVWLYLDGNPPAVQALGDFDASQATTRGILVGTAKGTPGGKQFSGRIDDLAVWNRVMTAAEIKRIRSASGGKPPKAIGDLLSGAEPPKPAAAKKK